MSTATEPRTASDSGQVMPVVQSQWLEKLRHMLGADSRRPGFRNRYCVTVGGESHDELEAMREAGLVEQGATINNGAAMMYGATVAGCKAIGLSKAAIKRAFED